MGGEEGRMGRKGEEETVRGDRSERNQRRPRGGKGVSVHTHMHTCFQQKWPRPLGPSALAHSCRPRRWLSPGTSVAVARQPPPAEGKGC